MILLGTDVVSELMRPTPARQVIEWVNATAPNELVVSAVTIAEVLLGIELLPEGARRADLARRFRRLVSDGFVHAPVPFDSDCAHRYGELMAARRADGRPIGVPDGQIAATARAHDHALATGNVRDFELLGLELINPFEAASGQR